MHIEEAMYKLEKIKAHENLSREIITHMNYTLNHAPDSLIDKNSQHKVNLKSKKMHIKRALIDSLTDHYNIYNGIESIINWVNIDYPAHNFKDKEDKNFENSDVKKFIRQMNYKFYGYISGISGITLSGYEIINKGLDNGIDTIPAIIAAASMYVLTNSVRIMKKENALKTKNVQDHYIKLSNYCDIETNAENSMDILKNNITKYIGNINYLHSQIILPNKIEYKLDDIVLDMHEFSKEIKEINKTISKEKVKISGMYELKFPKFLWHNLINRNYFGKIQRKNRKKAETEINIIAS